MTGGLSINPSKSGWKTYFKIKGNVNLITTVVDLKYLKKRNINYYKLEAHVLYLNLMISLAMFIFVKSKKNSILPI